MAKKTKARKFQVSTSDKRLIMKRLAKISPSGDIGLKANSGTPRLDAGALVTAPSMVVDLDGVCWWIDPAARIHCRV